MPKPATVWNLNRPAICSGTSAVLSLCIHLHQQISLVRRWFCGLFLLAVLGPACKQHPSQPDAHKSRSPNALSKPGETGLPELSPAFLAEKCRRGEHGIDGLACSTAAESYEQGTGGVARNPSLANDLWSKACEGKESHPSQGPEWACFSWFRVSCELGNPNDCLELGRRYQQGSGGAPRDHDRAAQAFSVACRKGVSAACGKIQ